jgi:phage replication O-like protein O
MANPQRENGYLEIANDLWEALTRAPLKGAEFRTVFAIIRLTWGWRNKSAKLTNKQIGDECGISDAGYISRLTKSLVDKGMVRKSATWGKAGALYQFQKDYDRWHFDGEVSTDQQVNLDAGVKVQGPHFDGEVSTDFDNVVSTDFDPPVKVPSVKYIHEDNHGDNYHPNVTPSVGGTEPAPVSRQPDKPPAAGGGGKPGSELMGLFLKAFLPGKPGEIDHEMLRDLIEEHGRDPTLEAMKIAARAHKIRRTLLPYMDGILRKQAKERDTPEEEKPTRGRGRSNRGSNWK